jgi:hypothetical protein
MKEYLSCWLLIFWCYISLTEKEVPATTATDYRWNWGGIKNRIYGHIEVIKNTTSEFLVTAIKHLIIRPEWSPLPYVPPSLSALSCSLLLPRSNFRRLSMLGLRLHVEAPPPHNGFSLADDKIVSHSCLLADDGCTDFGVWLVTKTVSLGWLFCICSLAMMHATP